MKRVYRVCGTVLSLVVGLGVKSALAQASDRGLGVGVGGRVGTTGVGGEVAIQVIRDHLNLRGAFNGGSISFGTTQGDVEYDTQFDLRSFLILADWHVGGGPFKLVAGAAWHGTQAEGRARPAEPVTLGGEEFTPDEVGTLRAGADYDGWGGYAGIGFGNLAAAHRGRWSASLDLGVLFSPAPELSLDAEGGLLEGDPHLRRRLDEELKDFNQNYADWLRFYPVLSLGVAFRF